MSKEKDLLKALGVSKDILTQLEDESNEVDVKAVAADIKKNSQAELREALKNDSELNDAISSKTEGKFYGTLRSELKRAGLTTEDTAEGKTIKEMVKALKDKLNEGKSEDIKEIQEQLMEAKANEKQLREEEIPKIQQEAQEQANKQIVNIKLKEQFLSFPAEDLVSKKHNEGIFNAVMTGLNSKYDIRLDENSQPTLYKKGTELRANIEDGTKVLETGDAIKAQLSEYDFIIQSNGTGERKPESQTQETNKSETTGNLSPARMRAANMNKDIETYSR